MGSRHVRCVMRGETMMKRARHLTRILLLVLTGACSKANDSVPGCPRVEDCRVGGVELRAHDLRRGPHGMHARAGATVGPAGCPLGSGSLSVDVRDRIARALADERRSEATYAVLAEQTSKVPLERIARSEVRHASELERLLAAHGHPAPPASPEPARVDAEDARAACDIGVASEKRNIALYDELLSTSLPSDVRCVFERLRSASATHHLPAFERCAGR